MSISSLGDLAHSFALRRHTGEAKAATRELSLELATGLVADAGQRLSGDMSALAGIEYSLTRIAGYEAVTTELGMTAGVIQSAITLIDDQAAGLSGELLAAASSFSQDRIVTVAETARQDLEAALGALNTRFGDRSVFSGVEVNQPAVISASDLLDQLEVVVGGALSALDIEQALHDWFHDPAGFAATAYLGGAAQAELSIAPGQTAELDVTVLDPAILDTLKFLAMPALVTRGVMDAAPLVQADMLKRAGEGILETASSRSRLAGRLGAVEAQIEAAVARNASEKTALELSRLTLIGVDEYETATRITAAETQLQTIYTVTARMQSLSLANFL